MLAATKEELVDGVRKSIDAVLAEVGNTTIAPSLALPPALMGVEAEELVF